MIPHPRPRVVLVAAVAKDRTIGKAGAIPWRHPEDQQFFRRITTGTALVMGRKTLESIGRLLPGRDNIVVTRNPAQVLERWPGALAARSLDDALEIARSRGAETVSIAGGSEIYALALPIADEMRITYVPEAGGGDVFFPEWDAAQWREVSRERSGGLEFVHYVRA